MPNIVIQSIDALADLYEFEGQPVTDSRKVAERFGKRHTEVLRSIRSLLQSAPEEFASRNFASCSYADGNQRQREMYRMTKDGFVLLAMGFTGSDSMLWKVAYINAFNGMADALVAPSISREIHDRVMAFERKDKVTFALAQLGSRQMLERKEALKDLREEKALLEDITQLRLLLGG